MDKEELKVVVQQEMKKTIMENLDSSLIFTYIQKLEQENKELKSQLIGKVYYGNKNGSNNSLPEPPYKVTC